MPTMNDSLKWKSFMHADILAGATVDYSESPDNFGFNFALALPDEDAASTCATPAKAQGCGCGKKLIFWRQ